VNQPPLSFRAASDKPVLCGMRRDYKCVASNLTGFVQQVAVSYVKNGYWFYVAGSIPDSKEPAAVDAKFIKLYDLDVSKFTRCRQRKAGMASVQYIRLGRFFLLMATHGEHLFFAREGKVIRDVRRIPIRVGGYSISHRLGKVSVRIAGPDYRVIKEGFLGRALNASHRLESAFSNLPFEPYAPVRSQLLAMWRAVNHRRALAGLPRIERACLRLHRRIVRPFAGEVAKKK